MQIIPIVHASQHFLFDGKTLRAEIRKTVQDMMDDGNCCGTLPSLRVSLEQDGFRHASLLKERLDVFLEPNHVADRNRKQVGQILRQSHNAGKVIATRSVYGVASYE